MLSRDGRWDVEAALVLASVNPALGLAPGGVKS